jgi:hypothetical protein
VITHPEEVFGIKKGSRIAMGGLLKRENNNTGMIEGVGIPRSEKAE